MSRPDLEARDDHLPDGIDIARMKRGRLLAKIESRGELPVACPPLSLFASGNRACPGDRSAYWDILAAVMRVVYDVIPQEVMAIRRVRV